MADAGAVEAAGEEEQGGFFSNPARILLQLFFFTTVMNLMQRGKTPAPSEGPELAAAKPQGFRNLYGLNEDCDLFVHYSFHEKAPASELLLNSSLALAEGYHRLWRHSVEYDSNATAESVSVDVGPLPAKALELDGPLPHLHATLLRRSAVVMVQQHQELPPEEVVQSSLPLVVTLKDLDFYSGGFGCYVLPTSTSYMGSYCGSQRVPCHAHASAFAMALPEVLEEELEILRALWIPIGSIDAIYGEEPVRRLELHGIRLVQRKTEEENRPVCCIEVDLEPMTDEGVQLVSVTLLLSVPKGYPLEAVPLVSVEKSRGIGAKKAVTQHGLQEDGCLAPLLSEDGFPLN
ncbi:unnamed protein product [Effrenium voratum]|nr:unnamed protein product [Effrenium voratum]